MPTVGVAAAAEEARRRSIKSVSSNASVRYPAQLLRHASRLGLCCCALGVMEDEPCQPADRGITLFGGGRPSPGDRTPRSRGGWPRRWRSGLDGMFGRSPGHPTCCDPRVLPPVSATGKYARLPGIRQEQSRVGCHHAHNVTRGRSSPLAIICVPISTSARWADEAIRIASWRLWCL